MTAVEVLAGRYDLSETFIPGYSAAYQCVINSGAPVAGTSVTLVNGDAAVCTITNSDIPPAVTIRKELVAESMIADQVPQPGEQLTYRITLTNTGGTATNYGLTDKLDPNVTFISATHGGSPVGQQVLWSLNVPAHDGVSAGTLSVDVVVEVANPLPVGVTTITNIAVKTGESDPPCPSDQCVMIPAPPNVKLKKELIGESIVADRAPQEGEVLTYRITLTNTGGAAINYSVTDELDPQVMFTSADNGGVNAGSEVVWSGLTVPAQIGATPGQLVLEVSVTVRAPMAPAAVIVNTVKETGGNTPDCPSDQCVRIPDPAHITITKTLVGEDGVLPGIAEPGEMLTYRIRLTNNGGATNSFGVTDTLDANTAFDLADNGGVHAGGTITWTNLAVPAYNGTPGILDLLVQAVVVQPLPAGTTSVANVAFETGQTPPTCPSAQCAETPTPPVILIDKQLVGESGTKNGVAEPGETLTYQITLLNTGSVANGFAVTDRLDPNVTFVSASNGGVAAADTVQWTGLVVPAYANSEPGKLVLTVRTKVNSPLPPGVTSISNIAFDPSQPEPTCPTQCVELPTAPQVTIKKELIGESGTQANVAEPGETLTYRITLTNTGGPSTGFALVDKLDPNVALTSASHGGAAVGGNVEWTGLAVPEQVGATPGELVLTVVTAVNDPIPANVAQIRNLAFAPGDPEPPCPSDQCVSLNVPPSITITKNLIGESGARAGVAEPGETLTYAITLTNVGGPAASFDVVDRLDANVVFANASDGGALNGNEVEWLGLSVPGYDGCDARCSDPCRAHDRQGSVAAKCDQGVERGGEARRSGPGMPFRSLRGNAHTGQRHGGQAADRGKRHPGRHRRTRRGPDLHDPADQPWRHRFRRLQVQRNRPARRHADGRDGSRRLRGATAGRSSLAGIAGRPDFGQRYGGRYRDVPACRSVSSRGHQYFECGLWSRCATRLHDLFGDDADAGQRDGGQGLDRGKHSCRQHRPARRGADLHGDADQ